MHAPNASRSAATHTSSTPVQRMITGTGSPDGVLYKDFIGGTAHLEHVKTIINVALANPSSMSVHARSGYLWSNAARSWVVTTLLGQTTYYSNCVDSICQVSVTPFAHGWHRFVAVLGTVYGQDVLYFPLWKGDVSFGTS